MALCTKRQRRCWLGCRRPWHKHEQVCARKDCCCPTVGWSQGREPLLPPPHARLTHHSLHVHVSSSFEEGLHDLNMTPIRSIVQWAIAILGGHSSTSVSWVKAQTRHTMRGDAPAGRGPCRRRSPARA
jgi:hypothetical protein